MCIDCSDVSSAFDRVDSDLLLTKLESSGLNDKLIGVIRSWLRQRASFVIVNCNICEAMHLLNIAYQGTVWGPPLWNVFFGDCVCSISCCGFDVVVYADACNAFPCFLRQIANDAVL